MITMSTYPVELVVHLHLPAARPPLVSLREPKAIRDTRAATRGRGLEYFANSPVTALTADTATLECHRNEASGYPSSLRTASVVVRGVVDRWSSTLADTDDGGDQVEVTRLERVLLRVERLQLECFASFVRQARTADVHQRRRIDSVASGSRPLLRTLLSMRGTELLTLTVTAIVTVHCPTQRAPDDERGRSA
jgi:hypothetical protein